MKPFSKNWHCLHAAFYSLLDSAIRNKLVINHPVLQAAAVIDEDEDRGISRSRVPQTILYD